MTRASKGLSTGITSDAWKELKNLIARRVKLSQIYLDPNNPRLEIPDKQRLSDARIIEPPIQSSCITELTANGIQDLIGSIKSSGFWSVDRIVLRPLKDDKYVVIEGNRRVASLKTLEEAHINGRITLPQKIYESIMGFEALIYQGKNPNIAWIIQGFRHTPGIKNWNDYPKAKFLAKFEKESKKSANEIASIFGMKTNEVTHLIRSYSGYQDAKKDGEYGDELEPKKFGHFTEIIFKKDKLQNWLGWDDKKRRFIKRKNLKKYISWTVPDEDTGKALIDVVPATRDILPKIVQAENKKLLEKFEDGSYDLEKCREELHEEKEKKAPIDVPKIIEELEYAKKMVETLPIPRLQMGKSNEDKKQKSNLLKIMRTFIDVLNVQIKNLDKS